MSSSVALERTSLSPEVVQKLEFIAAWPHWEDIIVGTMKEYNVSREIVEQTLPEYQRFLCMVCHTGNLSMFSQAVDKLWHAHILNTQKYQEFCDTYVGRFVHHAPILGRHRDCVEPQDICSGTDCSTGPDTCKQPIPGSSDNDKAKDELSSSDRFRLVYRTLFLENPPAVWNLPPEEVDGIAISA